MPDLRGDGIAQAIRLVVLHAQRENGGGRPGLWLRETAGHPHRVNAQRKKLRAGRFTASTFGKALFEWTPRSRHFDLHVNQMTNVSAARTQMSSQSVRRLSIGTGAPQRGQHLADVEQLSEQTLQLSFESKAGLFERVPDCALPKLP
jgi:hypothetical protein